MQLGTSHITRVKVGFIETNLRTRLALTIVIKHHIAEIALLETRALQCRRVKCSRRHFAFMEFGMPYACVTEGRVREIRA